MMTVATLLLRSLLALLAVYHLGIGIASVTSMRLTAGITDKLYGLSLKESPSLRYAVRMLGLYALALGALLTFAAKAPTSHREVIAVVAGLQLARGACRLRFRAELSSAFQLASQRNTLNATLLVAEAIALIACLSAAS